ncbi:MAG: RluA family pseudouridine synthase [bacterium]|nr:RluA family pseudouridine synthase [bacterium]
MRTIKPKINNIRIDIFLADQLNISRNEIQQLIKNKKILVNNKNVKPSFHINEKDMIDIIEEKNITEPANQQKCSDFKLDIVFEDQDIIIINKPAGLVVHPGVKNHSNTLIDLLQKKNKKLSNTGTEHRPGIVHRIDKDTEGLMIIAKNNETHLELQKQFKNRQVEKKYYAMVRGNIVNNYFTINLPLTRHPKKRTKMYIPADRSLGKEAISIIKVLKRYQTKTLIEVQIKTGRTHQIRAHLSHTGHPVIGDPVYKTKKHKGSAQLLQSFFLAFIHPKTKKRMKFELPLSNRLK